MRPFDICHCVKILVDGGTRFIGSKPLWPSCLAFGHELTLFTPRRNPSRPGWSIWRRSAATPRRLAAASGEARLIIDKQSGRSLADSRAGLERNRRPEAPLWLDVTRRCLRDSELWPLSEKQPQPDPCQAAMPASSKPSWLRSERIPFTSSRPTYIIGRQLQPV